MPRIIRYLLLSLSLLGGCTQPELEPEPPRPPEPVAPLHSRAVLTTGGAQSRTLLDDNHTLWLPTDRVGLFTEGSPEAPSLFTATGATPDSRMSFEGLVQWLGWNSPHLLYAYYPYDESTAHTIPAPIAYPVSVPAGQVQLGQTPNHIGPLDFMFARADLNSPASAEAAAPAIPMSFDHLFGLLELHFKVAPDFEEALYITSVEISTNTAVPLSCERGTVDLTLRSTDPGYGVVNVENAGVNANKIVVDIDMNEPTQPRQLIPSDGDNYFPLWAIALPGNHERSGVMVPPLSIIVTTENEAGEEKHFPITVQHLTQIRRGVKDTINILIDPQTTPPGWDGVTATEPLDRSPITVQDESNGGGNLTLNDPYHIYTPDELYWLSLNEQTIAGASIVIHNDIHLSNAAWDPICSDQNAGFTGRVFGQGHTISGLLVEGDMEAAGLFGYGGNGCSFQNLNVTGSVSTTGSEAMAGGIIGRAIGQDQKLYNISFGGHVEANTLNGVAGGLVGGVAPPGGVASGTLDLSDCDFTGGEVIGSIAGGIIGQYNQGTMSGASVNYGNITGTSIAGGIIGEHLHSASIHDAINYGRVTNGSAPTATAAAGGIVGIAQVQLDFNRCTNRGDVTGYTAGGIMGSSGSTPWGFSAVTFCYNYGTISADMSGGYGGGLMGNAAHGFTDCGNYGDVSGFLAGGIEGNNTVAYGGGNLVRCANLGDITGSPVAGNGGAAGLAGRGNISTGGMDATVDCYNLGSINAYNASGLILDLFAYSSSNFTRSYNAGTIIAQPGGTARQLCYRVLNPANFTPPYVVQQWADPNATSSYYLDQPGVTILSANSPVAFSASSWPSGAQWTAAWSIGEWNGGPPNTVFPRLLSEPSP